MQRAKACGVDAFALNIGTDDFTDRQVQWAYQSAHHNGMKVFLSFDFNYWSTDAGVAVGRKVAEYAGLPAQLKIDSRSFVSSFAGDGLDVGQVRDAAGVPLFFAPNFHPSYGTNLSTVDGALNWMAWPSNGQNRAPAPGQATTVEAGDAQYMNALGNKSYIAPISPWFFTHYGAEVPYSKNWLLPGDLLFFQRWTNLLALGPPFVEIISWNDFGESHYVGPLTSSHVRDSSSRWTSDMPHDGWLDLAKPFITAYKAGATSVDDHIHRDQLIYWYRPQPSDVDCDATDTCMSPLSMPGYTVGRPDGWQSASRSIFVTALLLTAGQLNISSGANSQVFHTGKGASSFSIPLGLGQQKVSLSRDARTVLSGAGLRDVANVCISGIYNFNAYVGVLPPNSVNASSDEIDPAEEASTNSTTSPASPEPVMITVTNTSSSVFADITTTAVSPPTNPGSLVWSSTPAAVMTALSPYRSVGTARYENWSTAATSSFSTIVTAMTSLSAPSTTTTTTTTTTT